MTRNLSFARSLLAAKNITKKAESKPFQSLTIPGYTKQDEINDQVALEVQKKVKNTFTDDQIKEIIEQATKNTEKMIVYKRADNKKQKDDNKTK